jgi:molybdate transport system substrate-binding protein
VVFFDDGSAKAAEIKVLASAALRGTLVQLAPQFERATDHKVVMDFAPVAVLKRRLDAGETFTIVILSPTLIDELIKQGKVAANTRAAIGRVGLGLGVPTGAPKPDISSIESLKRTLLNAKLVGYTAESESGIEFLEVVDRLGLSQEMRPKLKAYKVGAAIFGKGEADMFATRGSDLPRFRGWYERNYGGAGSRKSFPSVSGLADRDSGAKSEGP